MTTVCSLCLIRQGSLAGIIMNQALEKAHALHTLSVVNQEDLANAQSLEA